MPVDAAGAAAPQTDIGSVVDAAQRVQIRTIGSGPDVLLIPGLASSARVWDPEVARLATHYRLHVVQVRGFAGTAPGANAGSMTAPVIAPVVEALNDYVASARIAPVAVIGHSMGGLIGMELALKHPADVRRLLIVDALPFMGALFGASDAASAAAIVGPIRDHMISEGQAAYAAAAPQMTSRLVATKGAAQDAVSAASAASDHSVVARALYEDAITDLRSRIGAIRVPVTLLYPWEDRSGMPAAGTDALYRGQYAALPSATLRRIDGSRHFIMIDQPAAFADAVDRFLAP